MRPYASFLMTAVFIASQFAAATFGQTAEVANSPFDGINDPSSNVSNLIDPAPIVNNVQNAVQTTIISQVPSTVINQIIIVVPQPVAVIQQIIIQVNTLVVPDGGSWTNMVQSFCSQFSTQHQIQLQPAQIVTIAQHVLPCFPVEHPSHAIFQNLCNLTFPTATTVSVDSSEVTPVRPQQFDPVVSNDSVVSSFNDQGLLIDGYMIPMTTVTDACQQFNIQQPVFTTLVQSCAHLSIPVDGDWHSAIQGIATTSGILPSAVVRIGEMVIPCFRKGSPAFINFQSICRLKFPALVDPVHIVNQTTFANEVNYVPAYQPPVVPTPVYQAPVYQAPVYQSPVYQPPVYQAYQAPVVETPVYHPFKAPAPAYQPPASSAPAYQQSVQVNPVYQPAAVVAPQVTSSAQQVYQGSDVLPSIPQSFTDPQTTPLAYVPQEQVIQPPSMYQEQQQSDQSSINASQEVAQPEMYKEQLQGVPAEEETQEVETEYDPQEHETNQVDESFDSTQQQEPTQAAAQPQSFQQIAPPQVAQVPITPTFQLTPQVIQILPGMVTLLGLPIGTGSACLQTVIQACGPRFSIGINRAMNPSQQDTQMKLVQMINALSSQNGTLANASPREFTDAAVLLAGEYSVTPAFVSKMAAGVVRTFEAQNQTTGHVYTTFEGVSRILVDGVSTATLVPSMTMEERVEGETAAVGAESSLVPHMHHSNPHPTMRTNSIVSIVLAFIALTAQVSATYGAPKVKLPTTNNNAYKVNAQVPQPYKETKPTYKEVKPVKAYQPTKPVTPYKETKPVNSYKEAKPVNAYKETKPVNAYKQVKPVSGYKETKPVKAYKETKPVQAYKDTRPAKAYKETKPAQTNTGGYGGNGSGNQVVPLPIVAENNNQKPQDNMVPVIQVDPVPAITNDVAPAVDASTVSVDPAVADIQPAAAQPDVAPVVPVSDSAAGAGVGAVAYKLRR
ncbi:hypothetical protein HDU78_005451 [Chytriomyces hyalinus]|nr:hypothetical protein HDU78_005451 [Chytriomyces hyalinus]